MSNAEKSILLPTPNPTSYDNRLPWQTPILIRLTSSTTMAGSIFQCAESYHLVAVINGESVDYCGGGCGCGSYIATIS